MKGNLLKRIGSILLAFVLVSIVLYWWRYKKAYTYDQIVLEDANMLIDIDLREIEHTLLWDVIGHPFSFGESSANDEDDEDDTDIYTPPDGMTMPRHLVLFSRKGHPDILFGTPISIKKSFPIFMDTLVAREEVERLNDHCVYDEGKQLFYYWSVSQVGFAFAKKSASDFVQTSIQALLDKKNASVIGDDLLGPMEKEHHLVAWFAKDSIFNNQSFYVYGDFVDGEILFQGDIPFKYAFAKKKPQPVYNKNDLLAFWMGLDFEKSKVDNWIKKESFGRSFSKWTNMSLDSVLAKTTGEMMLQVPDLHFEIDTIVTYEYDDDFNKVEKVSTQKILAAKAQLELTVKDDLFAYMQQSGLIKKVADKDVFVGVPLLPLQSIKSEGKLTLTNDLALTKPKMVEANPFLFLDLNLGAHLEVLEQLPFDVDEEKIQKIDGFKLTLDQKQDAIQLTARVLLKKKTRNALGTLVVE